MLNAYTLNDMKVRRVLGCLRGHKQKSCTEITLEYNQKYPPFYLPKKLGLKVPEWKILEILGFLIVEKLVVSQILSFTDEPVLDSQKHYALTQKGFEYISKSL